MKNIIYLFFVLFFSIACNKSDDSNAEQEQEQEIEVGENAASFVIVGDTVGTLNFEANDFSGFPISNRIIIDLDQEDTYSMKIEILVDSGLDVGTIIPLSYSSDEYTNRITLILERFINNAVDVRFRTVSGTITITANVPFEIIGGQGSGIYLSGDVQFIGVDDDGNEATITGSFENIRIVLEG